jgi:hypothetical protein
MRKVIKDTSAIPSNLIDTKTLKICNLNRDDLKFDRQTSVIDWFIKYLKGIFLKLQEGEYTSEQFIKSLNDGFEVLKKQSEDVRLPYTLLRFFIFEKVENFERIILPYLENDNAQLIVSSAFKVYKKGLI